MLSKEAMMSPGPHIAAAQTGRAAVDAAESGRSRSWPFWPVIASQKAALISRVRWLPVVESGSSMRSKTVNAWQSSQGLDDLAGGERPEHEHRQAAGGDSLDVAQVIDGRLGGFHVAAHADQDVLGVVAAIGLRGNRTGGRSCGRTRRRLRPGPARPGRNTSAGRSCPSCRSPGSGRRPT